jgi:putative ABC transport system permease protein
MKISLAGVPYASKGNEAQFFDNLVARIESLPGVQGASPLLSLPLTGCNGMYFETEDNPAPATNQSSEANYQVIGPNYFCSMGTPVRKGWPFTRYPRFSTCGDHQRKRCSHALAQSGSDRSTYPD